MTVCSIINEIFTRLWKGYWIKEIKRWCFKKLIFWTLVVSFFLGFTISLVSNRVNSKQTFYSSDRYSLPSCNPNTLLITSFFFLCFIHLNFLFVRFQCSTSGLLLLSHCGGIMPWQLNEKIGTMRFTIYGTHWWGIRSLKKRKRPGASHHPHLVYHARLRSRWQCQACQKSVPGSHQKASGPLKESAACTWH